MSTQQNYRTVKGENLFTSQVRSFTSMAVSVLKELEELETENLQHLT